MDHCVFKTSTDGCDSGFNSSMSSRSTISSDFGTGSQKTSLVSLSNFSPIESEITQHEMRQHPQSSTPEQKCCSANKFTLKQSSKVLDLYKPYKQPSRCQLSKVTHNNKSRTHSPHTSITKSRRSTDIRQPSVTCSPQDIFLTNPFTSQNSKHYLGLKPMACHVSTSTVLSTESLFYEDSSIQLDSRYYSIDDCAVRGPCLGKEASIIQSSHVHLHEYSLSNVSTSSDKTLFLEQDLCQSPVTRNTFKERRPSLLKRLQRYGRKRNIPTAL